MIAVLLYHLFPGRIRGGFVGVDVFFAISGFLIIGHLLRGIRTDRTVKLAQFWARRARRLLPASLLVLVVTGIGIIALVPQVLWREWFQELGASAAYVENWLLAGNVVDYLGADNAPSPTQHYWSLSVEEQLYIVWPLILLVIVVLARKAGSRAAHRVIGVVLIAATVASFGYSLWEVANNPAAGYFVTPGRAWEFGAGGLLAYFAWSPSVALAQLRTAAVWLGLVFIAFTIFFYTTETPFPGATALVPVAGTLLVIWGDLPETRWSPRVLLSLRPVTWIGDVSYSLYLWHWPLIILLPYAIARPLGNRERVAIILVSIVLAWLTKRFVEDPIRSGRPLVSRPAWVSLVACLGASVLVIAGAAGANGVVQSSITDSGNRLKAAVESHPACVGAPAALPASHCARPYAVTALTETTFAQTDIGKGVQVTDTCKQTLTVTALLTCRIGDTAHPTKTMALIGDSHLGQWLEALDAYGRSHRIVFITYIKTLCAGTGAVDVASPNGPGDSIASCTDWGRNALNEIAANPKISTVVFGNYTQTYLAGSPATNYRLLNSADFTAAWKPLIAAGKKVVALRDTPNANFVNAPQCIALHLDEYDPCTTLRENAQLADAKDPMVSAIAQLPAVSLVDTTNVFCGPKTCHTVIGGLVVYFDDAHMTATFSRTMAPIIGAALVKAAATHQSEG